MKENNYLNLLLENMLGLIVYLIHIMKINQLDFTREQVFVSDSGFSVLCQKFSQLKLNMWKVSLRRNLLVKLIHFRYTLASKAKVYFSLRLYTYSNLLLLSHTY